MTAVNKDNVLDFIEQLGKFIDSIVSSLDFVAVSLERSSARSTGVQIMRLKRLNK